MGGGGTLTEIKLYTHFTCRNTSEYHWIVVPDWKYKTLNPVMSPSASRPNELMERTYILIY